MKRKDIVMIVAIAVFAAFIGYLLSNLLLNSPNSRKVTVPVVTPISSDFPVTSTSSYKSFFNSNAIDPTQLIRIGGQTNSSPFSGH